MVDASPELLALAEASPDHSEHRADEPYRRALIGIYARLAATTERLTGHVAQRHPVADVASYDSAEAFAADVQVVLDSLRLHHGEALARGRIDSLVRAIAIFGFHLASVGKVELLLAELRQPRLLTLPWHDYSEQTRKELAIFSMARDLRARYGNRAARNYIISHTETLSDLVEVMLLQKETACCAARWAARPIRPAWS